MRSEEGISIDADSGPFGMYFDAMVHSELELYFCVGFSWEGLQVTHIVFAYHWTS